MTRVSAGRSARTVALVIGVAAALTLCVLATLAVGGPAVIIILATCLVVAVTVSKPDLGFVAAIVLGGANGFLRRLAGWLAPDGLATPIVAILPAVLLVTIYVGVLLSRGRSPRGRAPAAFVIVCIVVLIAGINPAGTGIVSNALSSALLLSGVLAFLLTFHDVVQPRSVIIALTIVGTANAGYMIWQEIAGLTPWDAYWVDHFGYSALYIGPGLVRPLGLGASAAESAALSGMLVGVAVAQLKNSRNPSWLIPLGVGLYAVLTSGTRTFALPALAVIILSFAIGRKRPVLVGLTSIAVALPVLVFASTRLMPSVSSAGVSRVLTMVSGSEDAETSTVGIHQDLILRSLFRGLSSVIGTGTGQVSVLASGGLGSSEQDISNMALIGGVLGVAAMLVLYVDFLKRFPHALRLREFTPYLFIAVATIGQWMNVGYYGATPIIWASLGVIFLIRTDRHEMGIDRQGNPGFSSGRPEPLRGRVSTRLSSPR